MQEAVELAAHGLDDRGGTVARVETANAAGEVNQAIAVNVFDDGAFGLVNEDGRGVEGTLGHRVIAAFHQRLRARAGNGSAELNG